MIQDAKWLSRSITENNERAADDPFRSQHRISIHVLSKDTKILEKSTVHVGRRKAGGSFTLLLATEKAFLPKGQPGEEAGSFLNAEGGFA